jgi:hypothetical protein
LFRKELNGLIGKREKRSSDGKGSEQLGVYLHAPRPPKTLTSERAGETAKMDIAAARVKARGRTIASQPLLRHEPDASRQRREKVCVGSSAFCSKEPPLV